MEHLTSVLKPATSVQLVTLSPDDLHLKQAAALTTRISVARRFPVAGRSEAWVAAARLLGLRVRILPGGA